MCYGGGVCLSALLLRPEGKMIVQIGLLDKVHNSGNGARSTRVPDEEEKKYIVRLDA